MCIYNNILYHHGILGMKWGDRNGPPYPLGASNHSRSERKAGWRKSLDGRHPELYNRFKSVAKTALIVGGAAACGYAISKLSADGAIDISNINYENLINDLNKKINIDIKGFTDNINAKTKAEETFKQAFSKAQNQQDVKQQDTTLKSDKGQSERLNQTKRVFQQSAKIAGFEVDESFVLSEDNMEDCLHGLNPTRSKTNCGSAQVAGILNMLGIKCKSIPNVPEYMKLNSQGTGFAPNKIAECFEGVWLHG